MPGTEKIPSHARIRFDFGDLEPRGHSEVRLLEATAYEDMAALCNLALCQSINSDGNCAGSFSRTNTKILHALCRGMIATSVYFVEAYLNGIASDHLNSNDNALSPHERSVLRDWDEKRNRPCYLSIREKLIQYQRILLRAPHAPLQENNTPEIARFLQIVDQIRNPLAHPSPQSDVASGRPEKELAYYAINLVTACDAVDCAVTLVAKLENRIFGNNDRIHWLFSRGNDGFFPSKAFE